MTRGPWLRAVLSEAGPHPTTRLVLLVLARHLPQDGSRGRGATVEHLARLTGLDPSTVKRRLREACADGWLVRHSRRVTNQRWRGWDYSLPKMPPGGRVQGAERLPVSGSLRGAENTHDMGAESTHDMGAENTHDSGPHPEAGCREHPRSWVQSAPPTTKEEKKRQIEEPPQRKSEKKGPPAFRGAEERPPAVFSNPDPAASVEGQQSLPGLLPPPPEPPPQGNGHGPARLREPTPVARSQALAALAEALQAAGPAAVAPATVARLVVARWLEVQPVRPPESTIRRQGAAALTLAQETPGEQVLAALLGLEVSFPWAAPPRGRSESWDVFTLRRHAHRLVGTAARARQEDPRTWVQRREREILAELRAARTREET